MKKPAILAFMAVMPMLFGCNNDPATSGGLANTSRDIALTTTVNVKDIKRGFIISSGKANEEVDYSQYKSYAKLSIADQYYLVYEFEYYSRMNTDGHLTLHAALEFDQITIFDAQVMESNSGADPTPIPYRDPITGAQINKIDQTFRVPADADEIVAQRIIFKINPTMKGTSKMRMNFYPEEQSGVEVIGQGSSGCTIPIDVDEYKIETPSIQYQNALVWNHVKGADYYKIYVNDSSLKLANGNDYEFVPTENLSDGAELSFNNFAAFGVYGDGLGIKIVAYSRRAGVGFVNSDPSNEIFINL